MDSSFNLVDQPFIPCIGPDGGREELGLLPALVRAHEIREIRCDSPLVTLSLHRLLLAILHRNFGPADLNEWKALWDAGRFPRKVLEVYFEKWLSRFDLFDQEHPFYQTAGLETDSPPPAVALYDEFAAGNNTTLFDHSTDFTARSLTVAQAARGLIARQSVAIGFGNSPNCTISGSKVTTGYRKDAPLTRGTSVLILGSSLLETLLSNLTSYSDDPSKDLPSWERQHSEKVMTQNYPSGRIDLYTWQSRRLRLIPLEQESTPPRISLVHFAQGRAINKDVFDPMKPYSKNKDNQWQVLPVIPGRALWRDSSTILQPAQGAGKPVPAMNWIARICERGIFPPERTSTLSAFGLATDPGKAGSILLWRHETMPLPLAYLGDPELRSSLQEAVDLAERAGSALHQAARKLVLVVHGLEKKKKLQKGEKKTVSKAMHRIEASYWPKIERPFREFIVKLPGDDDHQDDCLANWLRIVCRLARDVLDQIVSGLDESPRMLKAAYQGAGGRWGAQKTLNVELAKIKQPYLPDSKETTDELTTE